MFLSLLLPGITQYLDERFTELRRAQITLAKQPAPKPPKEPKTDGEKVLHIIYKMIVESGMM